MPTTLVVVKSNEDLAKYRDECRDWKLVSNANPFSKTANHVLIDDQGRLVSRYYQGRVYNLVDKFEREYGVVERIVRICLGALAALATLGAALFWQSARGLFTERAVTLITALEPDADDQAREIDILKERIVGLEILKIVSKEGTKEGMDNYVCMFKRDASLNQERNAEVEELTLEQEAEDETQEKENISTVSANLKILDLIEIRDVAAVLQSEQVKGDHSLFEGAEYAWPAPGTPAEFILENSFDNSILDGESGVHTPDLSPIPKFKGKEEDSGLFEDTMEESQFVNSTLT